jgi:Tfp pilus assembly protein PilO
MTLKSSEKRLVFICVIVVGVAAWLLLSPSGAGGKPLLSAKDASLKYKQVANEKRTLDAETFASKPKIEGMLYPGSAEEIIPKVVQKLQTMATTNGLHLREVKPLRAKRAGDVTKLPVNVRFTCQFAKAIPFIYNVEGPDTKLVVDKLNVSAPDEKATQVDVELEISCFAHTSAEELAKDAALKAKLQPRKPAGTASTGTGG